MIGTVKVLPQRCQDVELGHISCPGAASSHNCISGYQTACSRHLCAQAEVSYKNGLWCVSVSTLLECFLIPSYGRISNRGEDSVEWNSVSGRVFFLHPPPPDIEMQTPGKCTPNKANTPWCQLCHEVLQGSSPSPQGGLARCHMPLHVKALSSVLLVVRACVLGMTVSPLSGVNYMGRCRPSFMS